MTSDEQPLPTERMQLMFGKSKAVVNQISEWRIADVVASIVAMTDDERRELAIRLQRLDKP